MKKTATPLLGHSFTDVLNELHQLVFVGIPGESDPFELTALEREYVAFLLACYYQCDHCIRFHERAVNIARKKDNAHGWAWRDELISATLFLHLDGRKLSEIEWQRWVKTWNDFATRLNKRHENLAGYLAYAIGIARHDENLMDCAFKFLSDAVPDNARLKGIIRDIDGVVVFMKAATSKNRSDPTIYRHLQERGILQT